MRRPTTSSFQARMWSRSIVGLPKEMPSVAEFLGLGEHLGDVQQRLGRDAADVQAHAAELLAPVDQRDGQAEVGGAERRRVAARTGAEHGDLDLDVGVVGDAGRRRRRGRFGRGGRLSAGGSSAGGSSAGGSRPRRPALRRRGVGGLERRGSRSPRRPCRRPRPSARRPCPPRATGLPSSPCRTRARPADPRPATSSPAATRISMTGTASKSPMSGTLTSITEAPFGGRSAG